MRAAEIEALSRAKRLATGHPDVKGVDFGFLYRDGKLRGRRLGIRFHVVRKRPESELGEGELLPAEIGGVPCDVVVASYGPQATDRLGVVEPSVPGISVGNLPRRGTGTLGCFVRDNTDGRICVLSNWHVLCSSTAAEAGDVITQPGFEHIGADPAHPIARLRRWAALAHGLDAAIATLDDGIAYDPLPLDLTLRPTAVAAPAVGMRVMKSGATSGETHGLIDGVEGGYPIDYALYGDARRWMDGFRIVSDPAAPMSEISLAGDSGAVWLDVTTGAAVGLHFAGEDGLGPQAEYALAHPMAAVWERLRIAAWTQ